MSEKKRLVVLGCGFAGYSLLSRARARDWDAFLVTPRNYFLFTPLLPSAVTGTVEFRSILEPARRRLRWVKVVEAEATGIDRREQTVRCRSVLTGEEFELPYDALVIAVGSAVSDHGVRGVGEHALSLTSVEAARKIRQRVLEQFGKADIPGLSEEEIARRLTFVVCGAGPTGVEVAAELDDLLDDEIRRTYGGLAAKARVLLLEAGSRILRGFDEALADYTQHHFGREGVDLRLSTPVAEVRDGQVVLASGEAVDCGLVVWAGGSTPVPFLSGLGEPMSETGRLLVDPCLRVPGLPNAFAAGDCASPNPPLPATAQVAQQQGKYLAKALRKLVVGEEAPPFRFRSQGMLAYIGGGRALADLPHFKWSGRAAWLFWRSVYLTKLVSLANKVKVLFDWFKSRLFGRDLSRF